mmetsp:Transcript_25335/g.65445  ORF Transcript_25335/g.65445 Transcript_25335/m.65445 type:complete len:80 (+) Transcript_25335:74-313(+)
MRPHSELQRGVLALYKDLLRFARARPSEEGVRLRAHVRDEFRKPIKRSNVMRIEYLLNRGRRQLKLLQMSGTTAVHVRR